MSMLQALPLLFLLAGAGSASDEGWKEVAREDGITVYSREREGGVRELKATGHFEAPPKQVWAAIRDYANYSKTMPYTDESRVLAVEDGGKVTYFYSVINAPIVSKRDFVIKITDESDWQDGKGYLLAKWSAADRGVPPKDGIVRLKINDGYWRLEPRAGGTQTAATYYVFTDPGGSIPKWLVNKANRSTVPDLFRSIRKQVGSKK